MNKLKILRQGDGECKRQYDSRAYCGCRHCTDGSHHFWFGVLPGSEPKADCFYNAVLGWGMKSLKELLKEEEMAEKINKEKLKVKLEAIRKENI